MSNTVSIHLDQLFADDLDMNAEYFESSEPCKPCENLRTSLEETIPTAIDSNQVQVIEIDPTIRYLFAIQSSIVPCLFRIGDIAMMHQHQPTVSSETPTLNRVYACAPTLDFSRDLKLAHAKFEHCQRNQGWFQIQDFEITNFFNRVVIPQFNVEINQLYSQHPELTDIPPAQHNLIF